MSTRFPIRPPAPLRASEAPDPGGLLAVLRTNILQIWGDDAYEADVLAGSFFGRQSRLLNNPAAIRRVLIENHAGYRRTRVAERVLRPILGEGLFFAEGESWRAQRRTTAPSFGPRPVAALAGAMTAATDEAFSTLDPDPGGTDLLALFQRLTLEIAARTMFSLEIGRHGTAMRSLVDDYGKRLSTPTLLDIILPRALPSWHDLKRRRFRGRWRRLIEQIMAERAAAGIAEEPRDLFDHLVAARDPETGAAFSPSQLRDQVATLIIAGHETTALSLFWAAYLLTLDPATQEAVAAEATAGADRGPEALPLTRAVVDEALRLYPPAFAIVRESRDRDTLAGEEIPANTFIMISPWVLHRHRRLWTSPDIFDPRRFLPGAPPIDRFAYLPFGIGPRVCVGAQFALTEATLVLARLARKWRITRVDRRPVIPIAIVTTAPDHHPLFRLEPRI